MSASTHLIETLMLLLSSVMVYLKINQDNLPNSPIGPHCVQPGQQQEKAKKTKQKKNPHSYRHVVGYKTCCP